LTKRSIEVIIYLFFLQKAKGGSDEPCTSGSRKKPPFLPEIPFKSLPDFLFLPPGAVCKEANEP
jgi:hypothetical protein